MVTSHADTALSSGCVVCPISHGIDHKHKWVEHYAAQGKPGSAEWMMLKDAHTSKTAELEAKLTPGMKNNIQKCGMVAL